MLVILIFAVGIRAGERRAFEGDRPSALVSLTEARLLVAAREEGRQVHAIGPIGIGGYNFAREVELGKQYRVLIISCNLGGGIILFSPTGYQIASYRTWEIVSVQLFDIDGDQLFEIITEQRDGVGTGFALRNFHVYSSRNDQLLEIWQAESYFADANSHREPIVREAYMKCLQANAEHPYPHITYFSRSELRSEHPEHVWVFRGGKLFDVSRR
ncbi:MAG TPA: hypothetical protein VJ276_05510 [Thermoanaerobaculia bacterium]|nr:hypothetical protein [Thermoanaerobaculia bacterium]